MSLSTRLRRPQQSDDPSSSSSPPPSSFYSKVDKQGSLSNYWEPLHFLLYKSGFQTWEYSSQFALRSYLYILFHELVGRPASWLFAEEKVRVFYAVRIFLALLSVITDTVLVVALSRKYGKRLASYTLAMLCLTSGCIFATTSFLPSSFSMYAMSLSSGLFLLDKYAMSVTIAAVGIILGWPFSILAFLPVTFYSLARRFKQAFLAGAAISVALLEATAKILRPVVLSLILCASHARTFSVINGYSAPIEVYKLLEDHDDVGTGSVLCVGSEWHRFPSSFFVPDYVGEVRWIDDGFRGLLPFPFNSTLGGTAAAPPYLNTPGS